MPSSSDGADWEKLATVAQLAARGETRAIFANLQDGGRCGGWEKSVPASRRKHGASNGLFSLTKKHGDIPGT